MLPESSGTWAFETFLLFPAPSCWLLGAVTYALHAVIVIFPIHAFLFLVVEVEKDI